MRRLVLVLALLGAALVAGCGGDGEDGVDVAQATVTRTAPGDDAAAAGAVEVQPGDCEDAELLPDEDNREAIERATLCLVNAERTRRDREPLQDSEELTQAARAKAAHMVDMDYFAHVGPEERDVRDWVADTQYLAGGAAAGGYALGENLGWASEGFATPLRIVEGWMNSPSHRENILREDYEDSGIGVVLGAPRETGGGATYVQVFGAR